MVGVPSFVRITGGVVASALVVSFCRFEKAAFVLSPPEKVYAYTYYALVQIYFSLPGSLPPKVSYNNGY